MAEDREVVVGIDLGTTYSEIAYLDETLRPTIVSIDGEQTMPSVVLFNEDGTVTVGAEALHQATLKSHRVVQWIKRSMGEDYTRTIQDDESAEPTVGDDGQVTQPEGRSYTPEQISAEILKRLVAEAEAEIGKPVKKAIITCPAWFTARPRDATQTAGKLAGLDVLKIVNEPTAAAVYYGLERLADGDLLAVYDLGGGTFDCSIIKYENGEIQHLASDGHRKLGGHDWTTTLMNHVAEQLAEQFGESPLYDPYAHRQLYENCERAKREFARAERQRIACTFQNRGADVEVTRDEFNEWTDKHLRLTLDYTLAAIDKAGIAPSHEKLKVLLVGGSTRLPRVCEALAEITGKEPIRTGKEDIMVALGAATMGAQEVVVGRGRGTKIRVRVRETTPHALGMLTLGGNGQPEFFNAVMIPEKAELPASFTRTDLTTTGDRQEYFKVPVLQGADPDARRCLVTWTYRFTCLPDTPKGAPIHVTFAYNASNQIAVTAKDGRTGKELDCTRSDFEWPSGRGEGGLVDLCFVIDATGSMAGCIEGVKRGIGDFCADLAKSSFDCRLALVEYRDEKIGEPLKCYPWTGEVEEFRNWVSALKAEGGGDEPESALDGIGAALAMQARTGAARVIVLVTDASTHDPDQKGRRIGDIQKLLVEQNVRFCAIAPMQPPQPPSYCPLADATGGKLEDFAAHFAVGHVDPQVFKNVLSDLGHEVVHMLLTTASNQ